MLKRLLSVSLTPTKYQKPTKVNILYPTRFHNRSYSKESEFSKGKGITFIR